MVGSRAFDRSTWRTNYDGSAHLPVAHITELAELQGNLASSFKKKVHKHEVGDSPDSGGTGTDSRAGEAEFADRCVHDTLCSKFLPELFGMGEAATPFTNTLPKIKGVGICSHFFGNSIPNGLEPSLGDCRTR